MSEPGGKEVQNLQEPMIYKNKQKIRKMLVIFCYIFISVTIQMPPCQVSSLGVC